MIIALLAAVIVGGFLLSRFYSYMALLAVSPVLALVVAAAAWGQQYSGLQVALLGLLAMALSQAGFLAGAALDARHGARRPTRSSAPSRSDGPRGLESGHPSASNH